MTCDSLLQASLDACIRCVGAEACDALVQAFLTIGDVGLRLMCDYVTCEV